MMHPSSKLQRWLHFVLLVLLITYCASSHPPGKFNTCYTEDRNSGISPRCGTFSASSCIHGSEGSSRSIDRIFAGVQRGGSSIENNTELGNENSSNDDHNDEQWRLELPLKLQKRRGSLHKILVPTGCFMSTPISSTSIQPQQQQQKREMIFCELYLLGTAHVSKDSCEDAKLLMENIKPDVLFVELCNQRISILEDDTHNPINDNNNNNNNNNNNSGDDDNNNKSKSVSQMTKEIMDHNPDMSKTAALSSVLLSKIQGDYATKLNVKIGGEFQEAYRMAKLQQTEFLKAMETYRFNHHVRMYQSSYISSSASLPPQTPQPYLHGCAVVLGDRPVRLTLLRTWESLSFFGKFKLLIALLFSSLKQPKEEELKEWIESIMNDPNNDILSKSIEELSRHFPTVKETIIAERDVYMSCKILQTARVLGEATMKDGQMRRIVAVVGAGHCPGIRQHLGIESWSRRYFKEEESGGGGTSQKKIEDVIQSVIETKKYKLDECPEMSSLISEITSIDMT